MPSVLYLASLILQNIALTKISPSTFMMLKSFLIVFTAILGKIFNSRMLYTHHYLAISMIVIGLSIVSYIASMYRENNFH